MRIIKIFVSFFIVAIFYIPEFTKRCFGNVDFNQLSFFLFTENGTLGTDPYVVREFYQWVVLRPFLGVLFLYAIYRFLVLPIIHLPKLERLYIMILPVLFLAGLAYNFKTYDGFSFVKRFSGDDRLEKYFETLPTGNLRSDSKNNLILLYVESLENTFSKEELFGHNLNRPLEEKLGLSPFSINQAPGTGWTTAGMVASQCGMPIASFMGNKLGRRDAPIFANLTCLSDILALENYKQTFFVGPDLKFSGMDKFYLKHGFKEAFGKEELFRTIDENVFGTGWGGGVNDDILLDAAFERIKSNFELNDNFNVTIVTTDNHAPDGYLSPRCKNENLMTQLAEVVLCTNKAISKFIDRLEELNIFENTVLVVMGDHRFMGTLESSERSIYFNYLGANSKSLEPKIFELTHFDVFPTLIELTLNLKIDKAHLGYSIFAKDFSGHKELQEYIFGDKFLVFSEFYRSFWYK